jgi:GrpB-like predicted nucleotidyltransferase (UPF0157 family)
MWHTMTDGEHDRATKPPTQRHARTFTRTVERARAMNDRLRARPIARERVA